MGVSTKDFWRLFAESRLRTAAESYQLCNRFAEDKRRDAAGKWSHALGAAKWLIAEGVLTRFQAKVLLDGRAGPFVYGPYQLVDRIGRGRLAGCFRAVHAATGHPVLLWFLSGHAFSEHEAYAAAASQLGAAFQVVHPCLSQTYQLIDLGDFKFVAIEDLRGATAEKTLAAEGRLQPSEACRVMRQVALAAAALHARGLVHGDIRPENVWIDSHGNGRLLQLPLSRDPHLPASSPLDQALSDELRAVLAEYAAPELGFAGQTPDALCDVYAIGCTTYQLLAGGAPFRGGSKDASVADKMTRHATEAIQPLEPFGVPPELAKVVAFAMAKDRTLRYSSAAQLAESLGYFVPADELSIMPQPAPTYAAYEAWRTTSDEALPVSQALPAGDVAKAGPIVPEFDLPDEPIPAVPPDETPAIPSTADVEVDGASDLGEFTFAALPQATSPGALLRARRIRARNRMAYALALLVALCIGGSIGFVVSNREAEVSQPAESDRAAPVSDGQGPADDLENVTLADNGGVVTVPDDGQTLWASPAAAEPIAWNYLPVRAEMVLALRPAELLRHAEGTKLLSALGPAGANAWAAAEADIKMPLAEVDQLTVAWTNDGGGWTATYVVRPAQGATAEQLTAKWQSFEPKTHGAQAYFVDGARAYAAPAAEQGRRFVISSAALMPDLLDAGPSAAPLRRDVFKLLQTSDSQRLATLLFTTSAMLVDSKQQFAAAGLARFHDAASWILPEEIQAAAISIHLDENCYVEARFVGSAQTVTPENLATVFRERLKSLASDVEDYLNRIGLHPHGGKVLIRLGSMARFVERQLRIGPDDDQLVINCYLPAVAAHNLVLGAELAISLPAGANSAHTAVTAPSTSATTANVGTASLADKLGRTVSLSFERETLERSIQILSAETGVPMEILGADLQTEGITKNQSFRLDEIDQPAVEILRKIMLLANPDGKLVYVIKPRTPDGEEALFITTRVAAQRRGDNIPPEVAAASKKAPSSKQK